MNDGKKLCRVLSEEAKEKERRIQELGDRSQN